MRLSVITKMNLLRASELPLYVVCSVEELIAASRRTPSAVTVDDAAWVPCLTTPVVIDGTHESVAFPQPGRYRFNNKGRLIVATVDDREVVICAHPQRPPTSSELTNATQLPVTNGGSQNVASVLVKDPETHETLEVFAYDRNCYHVGYPMDLGDIEDLVIRCPHPHSTAGSSSSSDGDGGATAFGWMKISCITCPLHNRIFDLNSGDLVSVAYPQTDPPSSSPLTSVLIAEGRRKGGAPRSHGCHQRIHRVDLVRLVSSGATPSLHVAIRDTFGSSNPSAATDAPCAVDGDVRSESLVSRDVTILSDKYNRPGAVEDFHEFDPKKGNSFVKFRPVEEPKASAGTLPDVENETQPPEAVAVVAVKDMEEKGKRHDSTTRCCIMS